MAVSLEIPREAKEKRMTPKDEFLSAFLGLLVIAGGIYGILQISPNNSYVPPAGESVIRGTEINISKFELRKSSEEIEKTPIICVPVTVRQDCA